jgi:hypothetical protein
MAKINRRSDRPRSPNSFRAWFHALWQRTLKFACHHRRFTGLACLALGLILFILFATFLPSTQPFEGSLTLQNLSFVSRDRQPFLVNTPALSDFSTQGKLSLILTGQFSGNPQLQKLNRLELEAIADDASWQISSSDPNAISLSKLNLAPQTNINHLNYDAQNQRLDFQLIPVQPTQLTLQLDGKINVQLSHYRIKNTSLGESDLEFIWQPDNQLIFTVIQTTKLDFKLSNSDLSPFWGRIHCDRVILDKPSVSATDYDNQYRESAILGGSVRIADKRYDLEENQFLQFAPQDSIRTLLRLRLSQPETQVKSGENQLLKLDRQKPGLQVDISGATQQIKIGLNPKLPVAKLQASFLEAWMPHDAVIALIAALSTLVMTMIGWLWEIAAEASDR